MGRRKVGYTRSFKKKGIKLRRTLYFLPEEIRKLEKLCEKDCNSQATQIENIVRKRLDKVEL